MRRFLLILGTLTLVFIVVAVIGVGILFYKGNALDAESKAFVDRAVPAIVAQRYKAPSRPACSVPPDGCYSSPP